MVLQDVARTLHLTNRSLIRAEWSAALRKPGSYFSLSKVKPEQSQKSPPAIMLVFT